MTIKSIDTKLERLERAIKPLISVSVSVFPDGTKVCTDMSTNKPITEEKAKALFESGVADLWKFEDREDSESGDYIVEIEHLKRGKNESKHI